MSALDESIKRRLQKFKTSFQSLNNTVDVYNRYQPWLRFTLKNEYEGGVENTALTIDTFTATATATVPNKGTYRISHIMLINFEYNKNGSGQANTFTLTFAFNPLEKQDSAGAIVPPMIIDEALTVSSYYDTSGNEEARAINTVGKHKCYMTYGYNFGDTNLQSPEYYGQALTAKSELRDGLIYYTITGYSSLTYIKDVEVNFGEVGTITYEGEQKVKDGVRASEIMAAALYACFGGEDNTSNINLSGVSDSALKTFETEKTSNLLNITSELYKGKKISIINQVSSGEENPIYMAGSDGDTLFSYLKKVAGSADLVENNNTKRVSDEKRATLNYTIEELDNELRFIIYILDPTETSLKSQESAFITDIVYQYPDEGNNIVRSFTPDFNFETIWGKDIFADEAFKSYGVAQNGSIESYVDKHNTTSQKESITRSYSTFSQAVQYSYNANLTTLGIPADIPIGSIIKVKPIINGIEYHYSGSYMVLKTTDRIDTNGFTTEYDLFKLAPEIVGGSKISGEPDENQTTNNTSQQVIARQKYETDPGFVGPTVKENNTTTPYNRQVYKPDYSSFNISISNVPQTNLKDVQMVNGKPVLLP